MSGKDVACWLIDCAATFGATAACWKAVGISCATSHRLVLCLPLDAVHKQAVAFETAPTGEYAGEGLSGLLGGCGYGQEDRQ